jgi:hypothetical protein
MKNKSSYNVYQDANGEWNLSEVTNGFGCIAPFSHAEGTNGHYYLSQDGVIRETEGDYLERTHKAGLLSAQLDNFDNLSLATKRKAKATYFDHKYLLCIGDTTYVYDEIADAWSTWGITFSGTAIYGRESTVEFVPGDSLFFHKPNSRALYKYGKSYSDAGVNFGMEWQSAPLLTDDQEEQVTAIGIWFKSINDSDQVSFYDITDGRGVATATNLTTFTNLNDTLRYREQSCAMTRTGIYHQIEISQLCVGTVRRTQIDKINLFYIPVGKSRERY